MSRRGADRPDDDAEQAGKSRRLFGRGRPEPVEPVEVPREETGWLDDLRSAKEERSAIGPGAAEARTSKSGRRAPGPDDPIDDSPFPVAPRSPAGPPSS
ncbi:hypothetical protein, partial [Actinoplanes sp. NPDC026623]|uniref:hypothetical protein n=1 Tax=Actinoplanes sp. NPDC026623 TaxID=3155610 RepID=UPI0034066165